MRVIHLALKDLTQIVRDRRAAIFLLLMPIAFTAFMGFAFGQGARGEDPRLPLGFLDQDQTGMSAALGSMLDASDAVRVVEVGLAEQTVAVEQVRRGEAAALVIVPQGFAEAARAGQPIPLTATVDAGSPAGVAATQALRAGLTRILASAEAAALSLEAASPDLGPADAQARWSEAFAQAVDSWSAPAVAVQAQPAYPTPEEPEANPFTQSSPGMLVMFAVFGLTTSSMVLVIERRSRTLQRLLTTPISRAGVIAGHALAMFVVVLVQEVILVAVGQFALGVDYLREPLAVVLVMVTLALWVCGLGLLIGSLAHSEDQVVVFSLISMFVLSGLGGAWFPLEVSGEAFARIGHLFPSAWAMDGLQNIVVRGLGLNSVLLPTGVMLAYALGFFGVAVWRFRTE